ncbi:hypothetical protein [Mobilicoccus pelagius]|uniref:Uncharacterized protein n=1 Tax=Mobilicoccus pelagius NBRC 104925 TaxID=1089455 RepID=H5UMF9_9MICO|nr:hypothetical protein [Mobilicoccus pelagius]GAB46917.1 hypothetical protein MOPEL_001_00350 [Mobilicoccus pelagius NBRC 104925]
MESIHTTGTDDNDDMTQEAAHDPAPTGVDEDGGSGETAVPTETGRQALTEVVGEIERRGFAHEVLGDAALRVSIPAGDAAMGGVTLLEPATAAVAILAETRDGHSAVLMRDGDDLFVVKRSPGLWEHFHSRGGPGAVYGSWRGGERTRFRVRHGALWQAIPEAVTLAERLGVVDLLPAETPPPPPRPAPEMPKRTRTPRAGTRPASTSGSTKPSTAGSASKAATKSKAKEEPAPKICPRCFVQLPASGICDCG